MKPLTKRRFDATLPCVPLYREQKDVLTEYAREKGLSISDVVRMAVESFLQKNYQKSVDKLPKKKDKSE